MAKKAKEADKQSKKAKADNFEKKMMSAGANTQAAFYQKSLDEKR